MPATTRFIDGSGPVFSGSLFPFLFITIACGAVSGFHSLISSGTTPKMIEKESHMRIIGYGGMLAESFVAVMALTAACVLDPGIYFAMNAPAAVIGTTAASAAQVISGWGFTITPEVIEQTAKDIGETSILSRAGGAPTLAVGMAQILAQAVGGKGMQAFWYHFAILFEALFILTTVDAGTRVGRFMIQDMLGHVYRPLGDTEYLPANLLATVLCVGLWGYFLYQGVVDPLGGINTLWQLFGVGNQMLAGIALLLCTSVLVKMKRERYAWVTLVPTCWLLVTHADRGHPEGVSPRSQHRLSRPRQQIQRRGGKGNGAGAREVDRRDAARGVQQLSRRRRMRRVRDPRAGHVLLHGEDLPAGAEAGAADGAGDSADGRRGSGGRMRPLTLQLRVLRGGVPAGVWHPRLRSLPCALRRASPRLGGDVAARFLRATDRSQVRKGRAEVLLG